MQTAPSTATAASVMGTGMDVIPEDEPLIPEHLRHQVEDDKTVNYDDEPWLNPETFPDKCRPYTLSTYDLRRFYS